MNNDIQLEVGSKIEIEGSDDVATVIRIREEIALVKMSDGKIEEIPIDAIKKNEI